MSNECARCNECACNSNCDTCPTSFSCGRLFSALRIIEASAGLAHDEKLMATYRLVRSRLEAAGWSYPDGKRLCDYADHDGEIRALTEQLIAALNVRDRESRGTA